MDTVDFRYLGGPWTDGTRYDYFDTAISYQESNVAELIFDCEGSASDTCYWQKTILYILEGNQLAAPSGIDKNYIITKLTPSAFDRKTIDSGRFEYFRRFSGKTLADTLGGQIKIIYP